MNFELISGFVLLALSGIGWCGYYLEYQSKQKLIEKIPENIREIYWNENEL